MIKICSECLPLLFSPTGQSLQKERGCVFLLHLAHLPSRNDERYLSLLLHKPLGC